MRQKYVAASENDTRTLVRSTVTCAVDFVVDILQFQSNSVACEAQKMWVKLAFGSGFLASVVEIGICSYYIFRNISIGRVYIRDEMSEIYDARDEGKAQEENAKTKLHAELLQTNDSLNVPSHEGTINNGKERSLGRVLRSISKFAKVPGKVYPGLSPSHSAPKRSYSFGSDEDLVELVKQRMKYEDGNW